MVKLQTTNKGSLKRNPNESDFNNTQIDLFGNFLCNTELERNNLSNTIEFWDLICRYSTSAVAMNKSRTHDGYLPPLEYEFQYNGENYKTKIHPALIDDLDGVTRAYYPSSTEELIEDVLRKIASDRDRGFFNKEKLICGVVFTIYMIREELRKRNKARSHQEVLKSLDILSKSHIEISLSNGKGISKSNYLSSLSSVSKEHYASDSSAKWVAHFHPLVAKSIGTLDYRQFNYDKMMMQNSQLGRWLHKRLSHCYTNASIDTPYNILFSTIQNESKLLVQKRKSDNFRKLEDAFDELKRHNVIISATRGKEILERTGNRGRTGISDILYRIYPHPLFVKEVKAANKRRLLALDEFARD